jgi:ribosomal protection tetracycline resistance protein
MHQKFNKNISSVGADFRNLAPVLIHEALRQAGTVVCEPVETFRLEIPAGALPVVTVTIARLSGLVTGTSPVAGALALTGTLPTRSVQPLLARLPEQTSGEAVFTSEVTRYTPVAGPPPARTRNGPDPLDRQEWFRAHPRLGSVAALAQGDGGEQGGACEQGGRQIQRIVQRAGEGRVPGLDNLVQRPVSRA